ncbi:Tetratricopeptide repeat (TPR)-like superfamily protein [Raphanus sativus]|nr:Tetratricopeptide repeat (TPR)-like superfamily protein [Raphanus sativus]KAJ4871635.1 Tetratricopeptide repeat (TPR)-like superfamily protein [Raphanus sativus]
MVEEKASACDEPVTEVAQNLDPNHASIEATVESAGIESTNNNNAAEESAVTEEEEREKTIELADELTQKGSVFLKDCDFAEAVDCFSRALEIRVEHYGELAFECVNAYYKYGSALLEKAQAEADPLGNMPKKDGGEEAQQESITKNIANGESVAASVVSSDRQGSSSGGQEGT